jgi:hypothetical protein
MTRKFAFRAALVAAPFLALFLYAAFNWYVWVEHPYPVGMGEEARKNPYLALDQFLARMGARTEFARSPVQLSRPPEKGVLILAGRRLAFMNPQRVREIDAWVRRGGLLVVEAESLGIDDPLLDNYGIERDIPEGSRGTPEERRAARKRETEKREARKAEAKGDPRSEYTATILWPGASKPLRVRQPGPGLRIAGEGEPAKLVSAMAGDRLVLVAFDADAGRVVALSSLNFLRNRDMGELNHAEFAWRLATGAPQQRASMLFLRVPSPSLWAWIRENAWPVVISAMILLLLWLGRIVPRFGPLEPEPPPVRRSLVEHLRAAGRFVWSRGDAQKLIEAARDRVWRTALRRRGGLAGLAHSKAHDTLVSLTGQAPATVQRALHGAGNNPATFVTTAAALQDLESGLTHNRLKHNLRHSRAGGNPAKQGATR